MSRIGTQLVKKAIPYPAGVQGTLNLPRTPAKQLHKPFGRVVILCVVRIY